MVSHLVRAEAGVVRDEQRELRLPVRHELNQLAALGGPAAVVQQQLRREGGDNRARATC